MSDASANPSCESPKYTVASPTASPAPLPVPPPPQDEISIEVDEDESYLLTPDEAAPARTPREISPISAYNILQAFGDEHNEDPSKELRELAEDAARAVVNRVKAHDRQVEDLQAEIGRLRTQNQPHLVEDLRTEITRLRNQLVPTPVTRQRAPPPSGFLHNEGRLPQFIIPHCGYRAEARYVRVCPTDATMAQGTMGGAQDPVYALPLHATVYRPSFGDDAYPAEPLPEWFRNLMHAVDPHFRTLLQGSRTLEDWGLTADIARYRATSERIRDLHAAEEGIASSLASCRESRELIAFRLGSARAAERLNRFRYLADDEVPTVQRNDPPLPQEAQRRSSGRARGRARG